MFALALLTVAIALPTSQERPEIVAGSAGKKVDAYLENCAAFGFSGCVLVQKKGKVILRKGYGLARPELGTPNTPETLFDIASASKQVTAAAILLLESQGKLKLDDSIGLYLPNVPEKHADVTLYHLLTHTSGFPRNGRAGAGPNLANAMAAYLSANRKSDAGERFEYYNGGYAMLAAVVERVTGQSYEDWTRDNLFKPAGLQHTDFIETQRIDVKRIARSHDTGRLTTEYIKGWGYKGMGGVLTSVSDLALWCDALFSGELLPAKSMETLLTPYRDKYACGWYVFDTSKNRKVIQHNGGAPGFESYIRYFPKDEVLILVLNNRSGWNWQSTWGVSSILLGEEAKAAAPPEVMKLTDSELHAYCGIWAAEGERLVIRREGLGLHVGGVGSTVQAVFNPGGLRGRARNSSSKKPDPEGLARAEERALSMVDGLRNGNIEPLAENMLKHIPKSWPTLVRDKLWPAFLEQHGEVLEMNSLGAFYDASSRRTRVWIRLKLEKRERSIEVAFVGEQLNIFDLKAQAFPSQAHFAAMQGKRMVGFDFQKGAPYELTLSKKGKSQALELTSRSGAKLSFERM